MTVTASVLVAPKVAETLQTTQYTVLGSAAIIDKFTATNNSTGSLALSVNLVSAGTTPDKSNLIVVSATIVTGATYTFPELVGHVLATGDMISTIASATGLTLRVSGRAIS